METFLLLSFSVLTFIAVTTAQTFHACQNHTVLQNETWRTVAANITPPFAPKHCDTRIPTDWLRFDSPTGGKMLEHCPPMLHCGTVFPVWLDGTHPAVAEGQVSRRACSHVYGVCCDPRYIYTIQIVNCGGYYVYRLPRVANCNAYCIGQEKPCPAGQTSPTGYTPGCHVTNATTTSPSTSPSQAGSSSPGSLTTNLITSIATPPSGAENTSLVVPIPGPSTSTSTATSSTRQTTDVFEGRQGGGFNHYTSLYAVIGVLIFILAAVIGILLFCRLTGRMGPMCQEPPPSEHYTSATYKSGTPVAPDHVYVSLRGQGAAPDAAYRGATSGDFPKHFENPPAYGSGDYSYVDTKNVFVNAKK